LGDYGRAGTNTRARMHTHTHQQVLNGFRTQVLQLPAAPERQPDPHASWFGIDMAFDPNESFKSAGSVSPVAYPVEYRRSVFVLLPAARRAGVRALTRARARAQDDPQSDVARCRRVQPGSADGDLHPLGGLGSRRVLRARRQGGCARHERQLVRCRAAAAAAAAARG